MKNTENVVIAGTEFTAEEMAEITMDLAKIEAEEQAEIDELEMFALLDS